MKTERKLVLAVCGTKKQFAVLTTTGADFYLDTFIGERLAEQIGGQPWNVPKYSTYTDPKHVSVETAQTFRKVCEKMNEWDKMMK